MSTLIRTTPDNNKESINKHFNEIQVARKSILKNKVSYSKVNIINITWSSIA